MDVRDVVAPSLLTSSPVRHGRTVAPASGDGTAVAPAAVTRDGGTTSTDGASEVKRISRPLAVLIPAALVLGAALPATAAAGEGYPYDRNGDKPFINNTNILERYSPTGGNNQSYEVEATRAEADAIFTSEPITVDGIREDAWDDATPHPIENAFTPTMTAERPGGSAQGTVRLLWDGPVLYALVEVVGDSTKSDTGTPNWTSAAYTPTTDGLFVFMDVFNDQWGLETDTQGVFFLGANPALTSVASFNNAGIPSLGSFFNPANQDYSTRLNAAESSGYSAGSGVNYTYEVALQIEGWGDAWDRELKDGTQVGLEFGIFDQGQSFTYWSKTQAFAGREGNSNLPNGERVRNRDWGVVTLAGKDDDEAPAYSGWRADENIRFWNSKNNPGGSGNGTASTDAGDSSQVWTPESKARMIAAKDAYLAIRDSPTATRAQKESAVREVCEAFAALRWGDTTFPDPDDLPSIPTLPSAFTFFDPTKGTNGQVTTAAEWEERKAEILELAQFYEYGYKPRHGTDYTVNLLTNGYTGSGNATVTAQVVPTNTNYSGGAPVNISITVTMPSAVPSGERAAVAFGGGYTANGIANVPFPNWAFDSRSDNGAWGTPNRTGTFYTLFPYVRNSTSADSSILIANATAVSVYLDALELAVAQNSALAAKIDPTQGVAKGFSIGGKNAFVAAVFDERIKFVVAGGAGATGPANWRYNAQGQEYDFTGTAYDNPGAESIVAHGTEGPGNSYRHNRVRETELFRHFMPYGHMYEHEEGSYSYGGYSRLPFDQSLLVATLAPERGIIIDTNLNDYNDGSTTDNMSLQIAKSVYANLGLDPSRFVKFNSGVYISSGDPHGVAPGAIEGKYLSDFFYGTSTLTAAESERLDTDPYALAVSDGRTQSPYEYYWGGYNGITGGRAGIAGADGWYFAGFDAEISGIRDSIAGLGASSATTAALTAKLDLAMKRLSAGDEPGAVAALTALAAQAGEAGASGDAVAAAALQIVLYLASVDGVVPAWNSTIVYDTGDQVTSNGALFIASWYTKNQQPGDATGPWQEIATTPDGVAVWTASRIFEAGDVVSYADTTWTAQWYTRNQQPGDANGPWRENAAAPEDGSPAAWTASDIYVAGDRVTYSGQQYEAKWWTRNQPPGDQYGPWTPIG
ncbi:carbohydrate-binding protein [Pseudolysinimonas sp.]|jgi:chitodextrinase|uniref:glucuronyl esterase domain-containing protein n=1 Tax=Pseudolysinimonas sp. TaxID=2680009 RepID=UPI003783A06C